MSFTYRVHVLNIAELERKCRGGNNLLQALLLFVDLSKLHCLVHVRLHVKMFKPFLH